MLIDQTISGTVDIERRNGKSQSKYHGYTTGAHTSEAAIGQAHCSASLDSGFLRNHTAVASPRANATPATICGLTRCWSIPNTGPLKRKRCTKVPIEPMGRCHPGVRQSGRNGREEATKTSAATKASRMRTRPQ